MARPIIVNKIIQIKDDLLWISDLDDFMTELYFKGIISADDRDYLLNLIHRNTKGRNVDVQHFITDMKSLLSDFEDVVSAMQEETDAENDHDN